VVTAGPAPRNLYIAVGRFDPVAIRAAVEGDPARGSRFEIETYRGVEYYRWGGDYAIEGEPTPVRPLGRGGRLVVGDGWLAWTYGDEEVEAIIDTSLDPTASLASVDWLRDTAEVADEHGLTRIVTWPTPTGDGFVTQPAPNQALPLIDAPLGWSGGVDHAPEGAITQYVLVYPTDTDADANLDAF
jgi:hypothetical protein